MNFSGIFNLISAVLLSYEQYFVTHKLRAELRSGLTDTYICFNSDAFFVRMHLFC